MYEALIGSDLRARASDLRARADGGVAGKAFDFDSSRGTQFTGFTSTKVQILTQKALEGGGRTAASGGGGGDAEGGGGGRGGGGG